MVPPLALSPSYRLYRLKKEKIGSSFFFSWYCYLYRAIDKYLMR